MLIAACESLSRDECLNADWRTIGFEDGANGKAAGRIGAHRKACASHDVVPDRDAYLAGHQAGNSVFCTFDRGQQDGQYGNRTNGLCGNNTDYPEGYQQGLATYCTYEVGYQAGLNGEEYLRVCPIEIEDDFLMGYDLGFQTFLISDAISELASQVEHIINAQAANDQLIEELQRDAVFNRDLKATERVEMLAEIKSLNVANKDLEAERTAIEIELRGLQNDLARLNGNEQ